jgi:hypothetical protein
MFFSQENAGPIWTALSDLAENPLDEAVRERARGVCAAPGIQIPREPIVGENGSRFSTTGAWSLILVLEEMAGRKTPIGP